MTAKPTRSESVRIRLSPGELARFKADADTAGGTLSDYIRLALGLQRRPRH